MTGMGPLTSPGQQHKVTPHMVQGHPAAHDILHNPGTVQYFIRVLGCHNITVMYWRRSIYSILSNWRFSHASRIFWLQSQENKFVRECWVFCVFVIVTTVSDVIVSPFVFVHSIGWRSGPEQRECGGSDSRYQTSHQKN